MPLLLRSGRCGHEKVETPVETQPTGYAGKSGGSRVATASVLRLAAQVTPAAAKAGPGRTAGRRMLRHRERAETG